MPEVIWDAPQYAQLVRWAEKYGGKQLRSQMTRQITAAARPLRDDMRTAVQAGRTRTKVTASRKARATETLRRSKSFQRAVANEQFEGRARALKLSEKTLAQASLRKTTARGIQVSNRTRGARAGVRVTTKNSLLPPEQRALPRLMNRGRWRHPVFGNRDVWVEQRPGNRGWFTDTLNAKRPAIRKAIEREFVTWLRRVGDEAEKAGKLKRR